VITEVHCHHDFRRPSLINIIENRDVSTFRCVDGRLWLMVKQDEVAFYSAALQISINCEGAKRLMLRWWLVLMLHFGSRCNLDTDAFHVAFLRTEPARELRCFPNLIMV
jgi:hypothetical protein